MPFSGRSLPAQASASLPDAERGSVIRKIIMFRFQDNGDVDLEQCLAHRISQFNVSNPHLPNAILRLVESGTKYLVIH